MITIRNVGELIMFTSLYATAGNDKEARDIVKKLLSKNLIACANLFPISSLFFWDNKLQEDEEIGIIMKTQEQLVEKVIDEFKKLHSYEVPCIVSWNISNGNKDYLDWISSETKSD